MITPASWLGQTTRHLVECQPGHLLLPEVCQAFTAMQARAQEDGIDLQLVSSFRSFERQMVIWNQKWSGQRPLLDSDEKPLDARKLDDTQKLHAILTWSALPGASRHHWGTDMDVFDRTAVEKTGQSLQLVAKEYQPEGPCHALSSWLGEHAASYGFTRPYSSYCGGVAAEPWHLSYQPLADDLVTHMTTSVLKEALIAAQPQGIDVILANLDEIFHRYTLNRGNL